MLGHLILAAALAVPAPTPNPLEIYRSALRRLAALPQPPYIDTVQHWNVIAATDSEQIPASGDERIVFDSTARRECVLTVPYSAQSRVLIADSYFAPDLWIIHHTPAHAAAQGQSSFAPDLSDLRTIAAVVSTGKPSYDVRLAGIEPIKNGGGASYHLLLRPLGDPVRHNLRELWVNTQTLNIVRAILVGFYRPNNEHVLQLTTVSEDFGQIGSYWLVMHHTWSYRDTSSGVTYDYDATSVTMTFPSAVPSWYFDSREFNKHRNEVNAT